MTLTQLRCFQAIAAIGSFSKAAEHLYMSQPAISKHITQLEQELQLNLFNRLGKSVVLSHEGRRLLTFCCNILAAVDRMEMEAADLRHSIAVSGKVIRFTGVPTMSLYGILPLISAFLQANPDFDVLIKIAEEDKVLLDLQTSACDIAFCSDLKINQQSYQGFPVTSEHFCAIMAKPFWGEITSQTISLADLKDIPLILNSLESMLHELCRNACLAAGFEPHIKMESTLPNIVIEYIRNHPCCYIGLSRYVQRFADDRLLVKQISDSPTFNYVMCWKKGSTNQALRKFTSFIQPHLEPSPEPAPD